MRSKYRKGSLNKHDENITIALNNAAAVASSSSSSATTSVSHMQNSQFHDNVSLFNHNPTSSSRKSLISNPTNFQHIQHMGPNDGKLFMHDTNTLSSTQRSTNQTYSNLNSNTSATLQNTSTSSSSSSNHNASITEKK